MHITNLRRVGGSVMVAVPPALLDVLHLSAGAKVGLSVDNGRLIVVPETKTHYSLAELIAKCDPAAEINEEDREWLDIKPVGDEIP